MRADRLSNAYGKLMGDIGLANAPLHDLRSICKSGMARAGLPPFIADRVQDHSDGRGMGKIYDRYEYIEEKRDALDRWEKLLAKIVIADCSGK